MRLVGPDVFPLVITPTGPTVRHPSGARTFSGRACSSIPKLYVVSADAAIVYVGVTKQALSARLRLGWTAAGESGYHGYRWRHHLREAVLRVWYHEDAAGPNPNLDVETVEAEVVYLVRSAGQWPAFQTEIHFHASSEEHREYARRIVTACTGPAGG